MLILRAAEQIDQHAQHRKNRRLPAAHLLRESLLGFRDVAANSVWVDPAETDRRQRSESLGDRRQQDSATWVQRIDRKPPPTRGEEREVDRQTPYPSGYSGRETRSLTKTKRRGDGRALRPARCRRAGKGLRRSRALRQCRPWWCSWCAASRSPVRRGRLGRSGMVRLKLERPPGTPKRPYRKRQTMAALVRRATTKRVIERAKSSRSFLADQCSARNHRLREWVRLGFCAQLMVVGVTPTVICQREPPCDRKPEMH